MGLEVEGRRGGWWKNTGPAHDGPARVWQIVSGEAQDREYFRSKVGGHQEDTGILSQGEGSAES